MDVWYLKLLLKNLVKGFIRSIKIIRLHITLPSIIHWIFFFILSQLMIRNHRLQQKKNLIVEINYCVPLWFSPLVSEVNFGFCWWRSCLLRWIRCTRRRWYKERNHDMREGHARILLAVKNKTDVININELCLIHPGWQRQKCDNSLSRHLEKD